MSGTRNNAQKRPQRVISFERGSGGRRIATLKVQEPAGILAAQGNVIPPHEVEGWFMAAAPQRDVNSGAVEAMTTSMNMLRVTEPFAPPDPEAAAPVARVKKAITTLLTDLPPLFSNGTRAVAEASATGRQPFISADQVAAIGVLLAAAETARGSFFWPSRRRTRDEEWHDIAALIEFHASSVWCNVGRSIGGTKPTSPLVKVIQAALGRIGESPRSGDAIAQALVRRRRMDRVDNSGNAVVSPTTGNVESSDYKRKKSN